MPHRPAHPCAKPGCPTLVTNGSYCTEHDSTRRRTNPEQVRFYGSGAWKRLRSLIRSRHPICQLCFTRPSKVVDHIDGNWMNNAIENLRALCVECNATRTASQHRARQGGA